MSLLWESRIKERGQVKSRDVLPSTHLANFYHFALFFTVLFLIWLSEITLPCTASSFLTDDQWNAFSRSDNWVLIHHLKWKCSRSVVSKSLQSHGCSPPGSSIHRIFQAIVLEWVAISFSNQSFKISLCPPAHTNPPPHFVFYPDYFSLKPSIITLNHTQLGYILFHYVIVFACLSCLFVKIVNSMNLSVIFIPALPAPKTVSKM